MFQYITVSSDIDKNLFPNNTYTYFRNAILIDNSKDDYCIGLDYFSPSTNLIFALNKSKYFKIILSCLKEQNGGGKSSKKCICYYTVKAKIPLKINFPLYLPLEKGIIKEIEVIIENEEGVIAPTIYIPRVSTETTIVFHLKKTIMQNTKTLQMCFKYDSNLFSENTPLSFDNIIQSNFHEYLNFANWEIGIDFLLIDKLVFKKLENETCKEAVIYLDIIRDQFYKGEMCKMMEITPVTSSLLDYFYKAPAPRFISIEKNMLDKIHVDVFLGKPKTGDGGKYTEEELKNCVVEIGFVLRNKNVL